MSTTSAESGAMKAGTAKQATIPMRQTRAIAWNEANGVWFGL